MKQKTSPMHKVLSIITLVLLIVEIIIFSFTMYRLELNLKTTKSFISETNRDVFGYAKHNTGIFMKNDQYYCVYFKDYDFNSVMETDYHETAHLLVNYQYEHFCEAKNYDLYNNNMIAMCMQNVGVWQNFGKICRFETG